MMENETRTASDVRDEDQPKEQMCCDDSGRTAHEHRQQSADGKCCVDE